MNVHAGSELPRRTASEAVAEQIRAEIQRSELRPGQRLRQGEVAARFGVSTTPVREAFALLQAQGLVRIDPHRGAIVFQPTVDDVKELYELRLVLETLAMTRAVKNLRDHELEELQEILDAMRSSEQSEGWLELHNRFHMLLYNAASMPRLATLIANTRDASSSYINMFIADRRGMSISQRGHQEILDACRERDTRRARKAVREHLTVTVEDLVAALEKRNASQSSV